LGLAAPGLRGEVADMMRHPPFPALRRALLALIAVATLAPGVALAQFQGGPQGPVTVGVMPMTRSDVPVRVELPGRAVAYQMAAIRPRVGGAITDIPYQPGHEVEVGEILFRLEDETLAAQLAAEEASVASAEAARDGALATAERYRALRNSGVSRAELEQAETALATAEAGVATAQARRDLARLALQRTDIESPIAGVAAVSPFSVGDIVQAGQSEPLTTVVQLDPIYVDVMESRAHVLRHMQRLADGRIQRDSAPPAARLTLETGAEYPETGRMLSPGSRVSATTGTTTLRLQFANPDRLILPGQFVRVTMTVGQLNAFLVPQRATTRSADGQLAAFVARDGRAVQVALTEEGTHDNAWLVTDGLQQADLLILDGLGNLRDGAEVTTTPVTIDDSGVVRDVTPDTDPAAAQAAEGDAAQAAEDDAAQAADPAAAQAAEGDAAPRPPATAQPAPTRDG